MASGAGSKGAFVVDDSDRKRLVKLRREHGHVLSSEAEELNPSYKVCKDMAGRASHNNHEAIYSKATNRKNFK